MPHFTLSEPNFYSLKNTKMTFKFLNSEGISRIYISLLILIQTCQYLSYFLDPHLTLFNQSKLWMNLNFFMQYTVICMNAFSGLSQNNLFIILHSIIVPSFTILFTILFLLVNKNIGLSKKQDLTKNSFFQVTFMNVFLFFVILLPFIFFEEFFHVIFCNFTNDPNSEYEFICFSCELISYLVFECDIEFNSISLLGISHKNIRNQNGNFGPLL